MTAEPLLDVIGTDPAVRVTTRCADCPSSFHVVHGFHGHVYLIEHHHRSCPTWRGYWRSRLTA